MPMTSTDVLDLIGRPRPQAKVPPPNLAHRFAPIRGRRNADLTPSSYAAAVNAANRADTQMGWFGNRESRLCLTGQSILLDAIRADPAEHATRVP